MLLLFSINKIHQFKSFFHQWDNLSNNVVCLNASPLEFLCVSSAELWDILSFNICTPPPLVLRSTADLILPSFPYASAITQIT